ncbi:sensor histidine kinase RegB [Yoonia sediminilitoris]|uniref:histidine kinase n=1 Tax=Yoonia sediminilitoris TaxID=1286148 RepID=A0A2T6KLV5_9RHOB|nr:ActS/PrrB/RegB family redox-sensitive histidine kinase [Yoonia sediminilitoris]PUB17200.1 two-component system sensor histidine kinase RegB [Yoonia sediminilitoris]RCW97495.1 two-component system sensor histidine kinase RegB [Yoonia sediminilitoris]
MSVSEFEMFQDQQRSNWVRLRTLVTLRWFAAAGQAIAIFVATRIYGLQLEVGYAALVIGVSVIANLVSSVTYPENKRLSEHETWLWLVFDIIQLSLLLFLAGGLNNPFAMLVLAPITIAATVLQLRNTILLGLITIALITLISQYSLPITTTSGTVLALPVLFQFGFWVALVVGVVFLAIYARQVTNEMHMMGEALLATQLALAREQKLTDLGGVVAAAAHELGTPLATIKLVGSELMEELEEWPELREDAMLIRDQANRCRDILHSMGRAGKDDLHLRHAPLETVVKEAAEPHLDRGRIVEFDISPEQGADPIQPSIARRPEIIHGLRNLIQNAVDFSRERVQIDINWSKTDITVRIADDGPGFPQSVIGRIGEPYVRRRRTSEDRSQRPGYEGMGLGLFIAKTLIERSGAKITFANSRRHGHASWTGQATGGAIVTLRWSQVALSGINQTEAGPLGENLRNLP